MSLKKIDTIKKGKWLSVWDFAVYGAIILIIIALFLTVHFTRDNTPAGGVKITHMGRQVFEYDFTAGTYTIYSTQNIKVTKESTEKLYFTFTTDDGKGFNSVVIDKKAKSVKVIDANCSTHRDCVYSPAITDNSTVICCPPHSLQIEPLHRKVNNDDDLIIGGVSPLPCPLTALR